jgi:CBS domain-containing protein
MICKDVMTPEVESICQEANVMEAAQMMQRLNVGVLPVVDDGKLTGVVTDRDITVRAIAAGKDPKEATVKETMTPNLIVCYEEQGLDEAARLMEDQQVRRLLVVNRNKELVGVLSLGDLAKSRSDDHTAREALKGVSEERSP